MIVYILKETVAAKLFYENKVKSLQDIQLKPAETQAIRNALNNFIRLEKYVGLETPATETKDVNIPVLAMESENESDFDTSSDSSGFLSDDSMSDQQHDLD